MKSINIQVALPGREEVHFSCRIGQNDEIHDAKLYGIGGTEFLRVLNEYRPHLIGNLQSLPLPAGIGPAEIMLREAILKAQGKWNFPYHQEELCHCRGVPTAVVDQAICVGAHTSKKVSSQTSASTACGTCRADVEAIIEFRLKRD